MRKLQEKSKEAEKAWHRVMADGIEEPKPLVKPQRTPEAKPVFTVGAMVDAFLAEARTKLKPATVSIYTHNLHQFKETFGQQEAEAVTTKAVESWLNGLKVGATTKGIRIRSVSACFGWAVKCELIPVNPIRKVTKPRSASRAEQAVVDDATHAKLMEKASANFRLVLRVLHGTGCRPSEASKITAENFNATNGVVVLTEHKADRTGKPRLLFLSDELVELLKGQVEKFKHGHLLRSNKGTPWTGRSITEAMKRLKKKAGVKAIAYGYRHAFATTALSNGVPDAHVASLLGHTSTAMLHRHYSHLTSQSKVLRESLAMVRK